MIYKAWSNFKKVPCCFVRLSIEFQRHTEKMSILTRIEYFWTVPPIRIDRWLRNDPQSWKFELTDGYEMTHKAGSSNWLTATKWPTKLEVRIDRWLRNDPQSWKFELTDGYEMTHKARSSNRPMVTKWPTQLEVRIDRWLRNDPQSWKFELTDGYEMTHKAGSCIKEERYCS